MKTDTPLITAEERLILCGLLRDQKKRLQYKTEKYSEDYFRIGNYYNGLIEKIDQLAGSNF